MAYPESTTEMAPVRTPTIEKQSASVSMLDDLLKDIDCQSTRIESCMFAIRDISDRVFGPEPECAETLGNGNKADSVVGRLQDAMSHQRQCINLLEEQLQRLSEL
jgi:hypothetical protein